MSVPPYIDIHFHADARAAGGGDLPAVAEWMGVHGVDKLIVLPLHRTQPQNADGELNLLENFKRFAGKIYRFCIFFPEDVPDPEAAEELLKEEKDAGAIGFGEYYGRGLDFDDPICMSLYAACAQVGLPVLFHMDGECNKDDASLSHLENALVSHPACAFVGHGPGFWSKVKAADRLMSKYHNLYADISAGSGARGIGTDKAYGRDLIIRHSDRVLFGTDGGPWSLGKEAPPQFELVEALDLPDAFRTKLCRENAETLFQFN